MGRFLVCLLSNLIFRAKDQNDDRLHCFRHYFQSKIVSVIISSRKYIFHSRKAKIMNFISKEYKTEFPLLTIKRPHTPRLPSTTAR